MAEVPQAAQIIEGVLKDTEVEWESPRPGSYVVKLPGTRKLSTTVSLIVGRHSLSVNAFVIRHPDENEAGVHRCVAGIALPNDASVALHTAFGFREVGVFTEVGFKQRWVDVAWFERPSGS